MTYKCLPIASRQQMRAKANYPDFSRVLDAPFVSAQRHTCRRLRTCSLHRCSGPRTSLRRAKRHCPSANPKAGRAAARALGALAHCEPAPVVPWHSRVFGNLSILPAAPSSSSRSSHLSVKAVNQVEFMGFFPYTF